MFCIDTGSHSPLCFLLLGPLTPSRTPLKAFRASSSSFRNMTLVVLFFKNIYIYFLQPNRWLHLPRKASLQSTSLLHRDTPLKKTRELPRNDTNRQAYYSKLCYVMSQVGPQDFFFFLSPCLTFLPSPCLPPVLPNLDCQLQRSISSLA